MTVYSQTLMKTKSALLKLNGNLSEQLNFRFNLKVSFFFNETKNEKAKYCKKEISFLFELYNN